MSAAVRRQVRKRAAVRCEYCRIHEVDEPFSFHLEHIIPRKHGGRDAASNLAWSCHSCNLAKASNLAGRLGTKIVPLFHPRRQVWSRHFRWNGPVLVGKTNCGRVTVLVLNINDEDRVWLRATLARSGSFPPE
jgi:hypothetical protein